VIHNFTWRDTKNEINIKKLLTTRDTSKSFDDSDIDYSGIDSMSDEEVHEGALSDPDAQPITKEQYEQFKRVTPFARKKG